MKKTRWSVLFLLWGAFILISFFLDDYAAALVNQTKNPLLDAMMDWMTNFGSTFVVLVIVATLFLWYQKKSEWILPLWASVAFTTVVCVAMKILIARPRPLGQVAFFFLAYVVDYSFPSLHAAVSFSAVPILDKGFPKLKWFWILFAAIVAFSRLYFGVHYLSDVVAGAFLGYLGGALVIRFEEKTRVFKNAFKRF